MAIFKNRWDIHNELSDRRSDFNRNGVKYINDYIIHLYAPYSICRPCSRGIDGITPLCGDLAGCEKRIWMKPTSHPIEECTHFIKETMMIKGEPQSLIIRTGQMFWLYDNNVECIIRGTRENGLALHHRNGNPCDDSEDNLLMWLRHNKKHGVGTSLDCGEENCRSLYESTNDLRARKILQSIKKARMMIKEEMEDSSLVWRMILVNYNLIRGEITDEQCYDLLVKLGVVEKLKIQDAL